MMDQSNDTISMIHSSTNVDPEKGQGKKISIFTAISIIVGAIVGIGGFVVGADILKTVGSPGMALIMWVISGFVVFCGGLSYAELGMRLPESGGDIPYLDAGFKNPPRLFSFLYCWGRVMLVHPSILACFCVLGTSYLYAAINYPNDPPGFEDYSLKHFEMKGVSIAFLILSMLCVLFSNAVATRSASFFTILKFVMGAFIALTAILALAKAIPQTPITPSSLSKPFDGTSTEFTAYSRVFIKTLFAYEGWANLSMILSEVPNPSQNVLKVIITSIFSVIVLYLVIQLSYYAALPKDVAVGANALLPIAFVKHVYQNDAVVYVMTALIILSAFGVSICVFYGGARVCQYAAQVNLFPAAFARSHSTFGTPFNAILITGFIAFVILLVAPGGDNFFFLIDVATYSIWIYYVITMLALLRLRFTKSRNVDASATYRVPLFCPILVVLVGTFVLIAQFVEENTRVSCGVGLGVFFLGFIFYYFGVYRRLGKIRSQARN